MLLCSICIYAVTTEPHRSHFLRLRCGAASMVVSWRVHISIELTSDDCRAAGIHRDRSVSRNWQVRDLNNGVNKSNASTIYWTQNLLSHLLRSISWLEQKQTRNSCAASVRLLARSRTFHSDTCPHILCEQIMLSDAWMEIGIFREKTVDLPSQRALRTTDWPSAFVRFNQLTQTSDELRATTDVRNCNAYSFFMLPNWASPIASPFCWISKTCDSHSIAFQ